MTDRRDTLAAAFVLFAIMVAHTTLETARDALFLARLGPDRLATVYLVMAAIALCAFALLRRWSALRQPRSLLLAFLVIAAVGTAWIGYAMANSRTLVFAFYVWTGLVITLIIPTFWMLLDRTLRLAEAKRSFALIGGGGVLGAMVGSLLAAGLGRVLPATDLVGAGAIAYGLAAICAARFAPRGVARELVRRPGQEKKLGSSARRYVAWLVGFGLISTIALTLGDLLFKRVIAERVSAGSLATTFGMIYASVNTVGLVIQLLITPRVLTKWGVGVGLGILPGLLVATGLGFALTGALVAIVGFELVGGSLRHSMHRVSSELLYLPIPARIREAWKPVADAIALRGGEALAAIIAFAIVMAGFETRAFAAVSALAMLLWFIAVPIIHRGYVAQFRNTLRAGEIERDATVPTIDAEALEMLLDELASPDELEAIAALELLAGRTRVPALVLYHPRPAVAHRALNELSHDREDVIRAAGALLAHPDLDLQASALAATSRVVAYRAQRIAALDHADPRIRAAGAVGLVDDPTFSAKAEDTITALITGDRNGRAALAHAISHVSVARWRDVLYQLLAVREPDVIHRVLQVLVRDPDNVELARVLELLARPAARGDVRRVFHAAGDRGLDHLIQAFDDPNTPLMIHQHIPRTISWFGSRRAADALADWLTRERDRTTTHKIVRALGRMATANPKLDFDRAPVEVFAIEALARATRYRRLHAALGDLDTQGTTLIGDLLRDEIDEAIEHVFRALGILHPDAGMRSVHDALRGEDDGRRAAAREILELHASPAIREQTLALLSPSTFEPDMLASEELFAELLSDPSESVRCVTAYCVAEARVLAAKPQLLKLRNSNNPPFVIEAFDRALARLDAAS